MLVDVKMGIVAYLDIEVGAHNNVVAVVGTG